MWKTLKDKNKHFGILGINFSLHWNLWFAVALLCDDVWGNWLSDPWTEGKAFPT